MYTKPLVQVEIYPDRQQEITQKEMTVIADTIHFLCKKAGLSCGVRIYPRAEYKHGTPAHWPPPP